MEKWLDIRFPVTQTDAEMKIHSQARTRLCAVVCLFVAYGAIEVLPAPAQVTAQVTAQVAAQVAAQAEDALSVSALRAQALKALQNGNTELAVLSADAIVRQHQTDPRALRLAADVYLRSGKAQWAVRLFDRVVKQEPDKMPELWQRGIALYLTGDFQAAAKQFEDHRTVNPNDVENAAWHFLCIAKAKSLAEAKAQILPAPSDPRIPMTEVLQLLSSGDTNAVNARVNQLPVDSPERAQAAFYGDFYVGLYNDAIGKIDLAAELLERAAKDAPHNYMGDVARVYAKHLLQKSQ